MLYLALVGVSFAFICLYFLYKTDRNLTLYLRSRKQGYYKDKVVWLTGASAGIGLGLAKVLSEDGAFLILSSRHKDSLEKARLSLAKPDKAKVLPCDLNDNQSLTGIGERAKALFDRPIDVLINNAGISHRSYVETTLDSVNRKIMEVNYFGAVTITKAVLPDMLERRQGQIVNINSLSGVASTPSLAYYCASKHALMGFMEALQLEVLGRNVSVVDILPGPVQTEILKNAMRFDGTLRGESLQRIDNGMSPRGFAEIALAAMTNNVRESWISANPELGFTYIARYFPSLSGVILELRQKPKKRT